MGGVYRIQTFFGFLYLFYIYKAPKSTFCQLLTHIMPIIECVSSKIMLCFHGCFHSLRLMMSYSNEIWQILAANKLAIP